MKRASRTLRMILQDMINRGASLCTIINYLFTCDYDELDVIQILTSKPFNCRKDLLIDTLEYDYALDMSKGQKKIRDFKINS